MFTTQPRQNQVIIPMTIKEVEDLYKFAKASTGNGVIWITSTQTGIGNAIEVSDSNKQRADISDYDSW